MSDLLEDCPLCQSMQVARDGGGRILCRSCGCNAPAYTWQKRLHRSDGAIYASVSRRNALNQVLSFLNGIEGAGYGGMAEFEIARSTIRHEVEGPLGIALKELGDAPGFSQPTTK